MSIEVKRKPDESIGSLIYRFTKKIQQSGVLKEAKRRRFKNRAPNYVKRRLSALHRVSKKAEMERRKKLGLP
jgi:ribosomal protein S21